MKLSKPLGKVSGSHPNFVTTSCSLEVDAYTILRRSIISRCILNQSLFYLKFNGKKLNTQAKKTYLIKTTACNYLKLPVLLPNLFNHNIWQTHFGKEIPTAFLAKSGYIFYKTNMTGKRKYSFVAGVSV